MAEEMTKEQQEKLLIYQLLQARLEELKKHSSLLEQNFLEIENSVAGLDTLKKTKQESDVLMPFGSGIYTPSVLKPVKKILVDIGAGVVMEKSVPEAEELLKERREEIGKVITNIQKEASQIVDRMGTIANELQGS